jgi:hypothetical protein
VLLVPATEYARERFAAYYTSTDDGYLRAVPPDRAEPSYPQFGELQRKTLCDAQGHFSFRNLVDGEYFVLVTVDWEVAGVNQGSSLIQRVAVRGGETKEIVLTIH